MQVGDVLSEGWALYKRFLWQFFVTALVVFAVLDLVNALAATAAGGSLGEELLLALIGLVIGIVGYFLVAGALVELVRDVRDGRADRTVTETYAAVSPRLPSLIAAGVLAAIGIMIGFVLLIVPGLILLTIWSMIVPVIVIEGRAAGESFTRSREVVKGNGWPVFGLIIIVLLLIAIASAVIRLVFSPLPDFLEAWLGSLVVDSLTMPFAVAVLTTAYFHLTAPRSAEIAAAEAPPAV